MPLKTQLQTTLFHYKFQEGILVKIFNFQRGIFSFPEFFHPQRVQIVNGFFHSISFMRISFRQYQVHFLDPNHPSISTLPTILHGICQSNITVFSITQFRSITCIRIPRISLHEIKTPNISCLKLTSQIFIHAKRGNKQPITHCWHQFVNSIHENYVIIVF